MPNASGFQLNAEAAERYDQHAAPIMAPFVQVLVDRAGLIAGLTVLDLACGTGFVAHAAAGIVGRSGRVMGVDVNPAMLAIAARHPTSVEWEEAPAAALPYRDGMFDAVLCQQGLQFFPDLGAALGEVRRVLREDGTFAAAVWAPLNESPFMEARYFALREVLGRGAMGEFLRAYSLGADRLRPALTAAGFNDVTVEHVVCPVRLPPFPQYALDHLAATPCGLAVAELGQQASTRVAEAITARLAPFTAADGTAEVPFASLLVTARA